MLNNIKKGFTLAEVAIVLVVMAFIASILTPTLISGNEQRVMETSLKKSFEDLVILQDAINLEEIHHTRCRRMDMSDTDSFMQTIYGPNCAANGICDDMDDLANDIPAGFIPKYLKTMRDNAKTDYYNKLANMNYGDNLKCGGNAAIDLSTNGVYTFLKNGVIWVLYKIDDDKFGIRVDVNGLKSPNKVGRDVYYFAMKRDSVTGKWEARPWNTDDCPDCACDSDCEKKGRTEGTDDIKQCSICADTIFDK